MSKNNDKAMNDERLIELPDDIEVIGPGQMLAEGRKKLGLSVEDVAEKLNFRTCLVKNIESECFDNSIPATFNRGYLSNYAKLVNVSIEDVLTSYDMLGVAAKQGAEMQSFSKITEKQAESNRIMWISYAIVALLVGSTVMWWLQDIREENSPATLEEVAPQQVANDEDEVTSQQGTSTANVDSSASPAATSDESVSPSVGDIALAETTAPQVVNASESEMSPAEENKALEPAIINVIFTFAGDCWVNIYDGNGERIAWGIKKAGYVMELNGLPPFKVTVGKPELVEIRFNGQSIDMSQYSAGNIAKFTLPLAS